MLREIPNKKRLIWERLEILLSSYHMGFSVHLAARYGVLIQIS